MRVKFTQPLHPLAYGYSEVTSAFRSNFPVYNVSPPDRARVVLQWGTKPPTEEREEEKGETGKEKEKKEKEAVPLLISGGMRGEDNLEGRPAILDIPTARGRVLAYNFNPMHRDLNRSDYRLLGTHC